MWKIVIQMLWGVLAMILPSLVGRVLLALGIGFVAFTGFQVSMNFLYSQMQTYMAGMPADVLSLLGFLWVDKAIGALFSAFTVALSIKTATAGIVRKMVLK